MAEKGAAMMGVAVMGVAVTGRAVTEPAALGVVAAANGGGWNVNPKPGGATEVAGEGEAVIGVAMPGEGVAAAAYCGGMYCGGTLRK